MIDVIGDIHGHADALKALLLKLGYNQRGGSYRHSERKVLFVGDYIDRGPQIRETLRLVRSMVDSDSALALMGNHEYNALCYHTLGQEGQPLRPHTDKNKDQHAKTLGAFEGHTQEFKGYLEWFMQLPLFYETDAFRAVHACWDPASLEGLKDRLQGGRLSWETLEDSTREGSALFNAVETVLKGKEVVLPEGFFFLDKDQIERRHLRIKWWVDPRGKNYQNLGLDASLKLPEQEVVSEEAAAWDYYGEEEKNVFFGHYWLRGQPSLLGKNICCVDYSVAEGGVLSAYRWEGEETLDNARFVFV
jgi:hypothetical protein